MEALTAERLEFFLRFFHPEKACAAFPGHADLSAEDKARLYGMRLEQYESMTLELRRRNRSAVEGLLQDGSFAELVAALPFRRGDKVLAFGDSITDDSLSWAELLRLVLARADPESPVEVFNDGVSGDTTAQGVARFVASMAVKPTWIVFMIGTNDARRHGREAARTQIPTEETVANLRTMREMARRRTGARLVWMTPTPVIEARFASHWLMAPQEAWYANRDLLAIAEAVHTLPDTVVDLWRCFEERMSDDLYLDDGLHPSSAGQQLILRALLEGLASGAPSRP